MSTLEMGILCIVALAVLFGVIVFGLALFMVAVKLVVWVLFKILKGIFYGIPWCICHGLEGIGHLIGKAVLWHHGPDHEDYATEYELLKSTDTYWSDEELRESAAVYAMRRLVVKVWDLKETEDESREWLREADQAYHARMRKRQRRLKGASADRSILV